jgi:hypothetical protein
MLYYRTPLLTRLADKYEVRTYVAEKVGPHILNELCGMWEGVEDIDFATLPDTCVLKVNWGSGMNIFCRDRSKFDVVKTKAQLSMWMRRNYYWKYREWCYKNIRPRVIGERLLSDAAGRDPTEYCFYCFDGEPRFVRVHTDRFGQWGRDLFDLHWRVVPFSINFPPSGRVIPRPSNLGEMVACARALSHGFPFVRVDLYSIGGRTVFDEMTWYPAAGEIRFVPESYDHYWGEALRLPAKTRTRRWPALRSDGDAPVETVSKA